MDKTAQKRSRKHRVREWMSPSGVLSKVFNPQFTKVWDSIVRKDNGIRSILEGKTVDKNIDPGLIIEKGTAKSFIDEAKKLLSRREYISSVSNLSVFHKRMQDIVNVIDSLNADLSQVHHEFLFGKKMPDKQHMERLQDFEKRIATQQAELIKRAGLIDTIRNLFSERGRALSTWEKNYPDRVTPFREGLKTLVDEANELYGTVATHLDAMGTLRAQRRIDAYVDEAKKIKQAFGPFDKNFRTFYNNVVKPWVAEERKRREEAAKAYLPIPKAPATENTPPLPEAFGPVPSSGQVDQTPPGTGTPDMRPPLLPVNVNTSGTMPFSPPEAEIGSKSDEVFRKIVREQQERAKAREEAAKAANLPAKVTSQAFLQSLQSLSQEDPKILAFYISKYACSIQVDDPEAALQLFKIAKSLRG